MSEAELREDINVLNVVNFGGGSYVLYAELLDGGEIEVDPEPYSDNFARPARLLPVEAKALIAAIDLIGEHIPEGSLASAREKIVTAFGEDPTHAGLQIAAAGGDDSDIAKVVSLAIAQRRLLNSSTTRPTRTSSRCGTVEPYALTNGREGWYVACFDPASDDVRHFRLDRIKTPSREDETSSRGPRSTRPPSRRLAAHRRGRGVPHRARLWISPERARWAREERTVSEELADGAIVVELSFAGVD